MPVILGTRVTDYPRCHPATKFVTSIEELHRDAAGIELAGACDTADATTNNDDH